MVFLYRPVVLEGPSHSYLIGWGDESMVRNVQAWTQDSPALNIFCFPSIEVRAETSTFLSIRAAVNDDALTRTLVGTTSGYTPCHMHRSSRFGASLVER